MRLRILTYICATAVVAMLVACSTPDTADDDPDVAQQPEETVDEQLDQLEEKAADGEFVVDFRDRSIDLYPYIQGFPYTRFTPKLEYGFMVYFETTPDGEWMQLLRFDEDDERIDVTQGERVHDVDWSTRNWRRAQYNDVLERLLFMADEQNDEVFNLYALDLDSGEMEMLTDVDYLYGYGFSDDHTLLGYVVRHGSSEPFNSCLHIRDLETDEDTEIWCDEGGEDRLTWTGMDFSDDDESVVVRMQHDGNRNTTNIGRFSISEPSQPEFLLERGVEHLTLSPMRDTYDGNQLLYVSAKRGINNIYRHDLETGESERLTDLEHDIASAIVVERQDHPPVLLVLLDLPYGTIAELRDPTDGELLWSQRRGESITVRDDHAGEALLALSSVDTPFRMEQASIDIEAGLDALDDADEAPQLVTEYFAGIPDELADEIVQCDVERIEYPTFDEVDGETRMLHAYLYEPRDQPPKTERIAQITAFYGGSNNFRTPYQIMCEAGITTLSPAPRGSRGFGAEFAALNDGDLGGDDIVDLIYAARWLEEHHGFQPHQIGVRGASHGGYATMRALTFPPQTNERDEFYPFGFGHSHAGVSDLLHFYNTSNIPDWLVLLAGDPDEEPERLEQRSPLTHIDRLESPLLLTHGTHDSRVPADESERFAKAAKELNLPVTYEEFEGQGHGISGLDNRLRYYRSIFEFLETEVDPQLEQASDVD